jgi:hypothetical protein
MLVVGPILSLSLAMDNSEIEHNGGGGSGGGAAAVAAVTVAAVGNKDRWWWRLIAAAALDQGHATTCQHSKRVAQQEDERAVQGEAMQQPAYLPPHCHYDMQRCFLSHRHSITRHCYLPRRHGNT